MSLNRFVLALVAALFVATLASANSTNVTTEFLNSGPSANDRAGAYAGHFSTNAGQAMPTMFVAYNSNTSTGASGDARIGGPLSGTIGYGQGFTAPASTHITAVGGPQNNVRFKTPYSTPGAGGHALSTPEPGSLMLLSTGLMGIAGMVRRKLRLG